MTMYDPFEELRQLVKREQQRANIAEERMRKAEAVADDLDASLFDALRRVDEAEAALRKIARMTDTGYTEVVGVMTEIAVPVHQVALAALPGPTCRTCGKRTCCEGHDCPPEDDQCQ